MTRAHTYNGRYTGEHLNQVAFPLGGIGAGMVCLEGTGGISQVSVRNRPDVFHEPLVFAALSLRSPHPVARVLEGPPPPCKVYGRAGSGNGRHGTNLGLPRFADATFEARFPFGNVDLAHPDVPLAVRVTGWSPFLPGNADDSSLPFAALSYRFVHTGSQIAEGMFSIHARNFMATAHWPDDGQSVSAMENGFVLRQAGTEASPQDEGAFVVSALEPDVKTNCAWFRGGHFDPLTMVWKSIHGCEAVTGAPVRDGQPSPGGSLYIPLRLEAGECREIRLILTWYVPESDLRVGPASDDPTCCDREPAGGKRLPTHRPWYAGRFENIEAITAYVRQRYDSLLDESERFREAFYDTTLPPEVIEAVAGNLSILKSPTVLRQTDGKLWCFEGCTDDQGCCPGSCTHVWNYAQAFPHLFPELERSLRQTEFNDAQDERGHQNFRTALPILPTSVTGHGGHSAADGQLGGVMKVYREWRISGDTEWLCSLWPHVKRSLSYCMDTWDPDRLGVLVEPHHNTYDIEFWGPDGMCGSIYLGALRAASLMAEVLGEDGSEYEALYEKGRTYLEGDLFNGEYFIQKIRWEELRAGDPADAAAAPSWVTYSPEAEVLLRQEGPRHQYGDGCLSDGVLGAWIASMCGVGPILDEDKVRSHLLAVHGHNLKKDLSDHANPQRPGYALGEEGGLLLCTWPRGNGLSLPFIYSDEVWTGIEYQVASHLMIMGCIEEGLEIVRTARDRYDGRVRNPFDEYECGHWYARALSSYGLLQGLTGIRYDAVENVLHVAPRRAGDFRSFLSTATGYGTVGVRDGVPFVEVRHGTIPYEEIVYLPAPGC